MLFQNAPAPFDRIVFAVVRWVVQQLDGFTRIVGERDHPLEELGAHAAAFRAIVHLELEVADLGLLLRRQSLPPVLQAIDDKITGLEGMSEGQMQLPTIFLQNPQRHVFFLTAHIVVGRWGIPAGLAAPGIVPNLHRGFTVHAQAQDRPFLGARDPGEGFPILFCQVGKDGVRFREFFWGLALTTGRRR